MLKNSLSFLLLLVMIPAFSQQTLPFRLFMYNLQNINPAFTAKNDEQQLTMMGSGYVYSKVRFPIQNNSLISYEKYLKKINSGIGLQFNQVNDFHYKTYGIFYRYGFKISEVSKISAGIGFKIATMRNVEVDTLGNLISSNTSVKPDTDLGIAYQRDNFYTGISMTHINNPILPPYQYVIPLKRQINVYTGNKFKPAKWLDIEPMLWYRQTLSNIGTKELGLNLQTRITWILLGGGYSYTQNAYANISHMNIQPYTYKGWNLSVGVTAFKKLELAYVVYSHPQSVSRRQNGFFYEFMGKVKF